MRRVISRLSIWVCLLAGFGLLGSAWAAEGTSRPQTTRELTVAGDDEMLWIALGEWDQDREQFVTRFWYRAAKKDQVAPAASLPPQLHRVRRCAAAGRVLDVFFDSHTHPDSHAHYRYTITREPRYTTTRERRVHQLPGGALPIAMAGDVQKGGARIWAVVQSEVATKVEDRWRQRQAESDEDAKKDKSGASGLSISPLPPLPAKVDKALHVVSYDGLAWQPEIAAPPECTKAEVVWLAVADGRLHLFWRDADSDHEVLYARYESGGWTLGTPINAASAVQTATAAVINKQIIFAALLKGPDDQHLQCEQWSRGVGGPPQGAWNQPAPLLDEQGQRLRLPADSQVGLFSDRLVAVRFGQDGPQAAFWYCATGGKPDQPFATLPSPVSPESPGSPRGLRDFLTMLVVAGMLLLVFWRRQESLASPLAVPADMQVVGPAKRALAFILDTVPAAVIALCIWHGPIVSFCHAVNVAAMAGEPMIETPREVIWAWFWFRVIYTVYCTAFEALMAATPGKRLLGCQVLSETLEPPSRLQIGIRNLARMVELEPYLKIWPFLFVVFFTRNRQRMGDLLARTIVVERRAVLLGDDNRHDRLPPAEE